MKTILFIIVAALSFSILTPNANSQCPTPKDYPGDPFNYGGTRNIALTPTCTLRYDFCYRLANGVYFDSFITNLELIGDCDFYKIDILNNLDQYLNMCHDDVSLNVNPWSASDIPECCPPSTQQPCFSGWYWRQGNYACYTEWYWDTVTQTWKTGNCDVENEGQCWHRSRYCWYNEFGPQGQTIKKYNTERQPIVNDGVCPEFGGINNDLECHPACD